MQIVPPPSRSEVVSAVEGLSAELDWQRPPYHAFEHKGSRLLYDLHSGSLIELSEVAFALLRGLESARPVEELAGELARLAPDDPIRVVEEVRLLRQEGFMRNEAPLTEQQRRNHLRGLMSHKPRKMMLMVQSNCNLKCTYCYEVLSGFHATGKRMEFEAAQRSVEHLIRRSGNRRDVEITFFGGEPLLNYPLIEQVVAYCHEREQQLDKTFHYQITTNCTLLTDEMIEFFVRERFGAMVSLDGPPELNDIHRVDLGGAGTGALALANAKKLVAAQKAAGLRPAMVRITMTHENHDARALERYFSQQGFERVMVGASDGRADKKESWDLGEEDAQEMHAGGEQFLDDYLAWIDGIGPKPDSAESAPRNLHTILEALRTPDTGPRIRCGVGRNMQAITRDGKIYPCHRYAGEDAFLLGTVEGGIDENRLRSYYESIVDVKEKHCSHCWARVTCGGQCPWYISKSDGTVIGPDEESCNGIRRGHERLLWLAHQLRRRGKLPETIEPVEEE